MKKMLFILLAVMSTATMFAAEEAVIEQTNVTEAVYLWRDGCKIYQGDQLLTQQEYKNLLRNTCPEAFAQYKKGTVMANWGWGVFGAGALSMVASCIPLYLPNPYSSDPESGEWPQHHQFADARLTAGLAMIFVGTVVVASSIPIICVGYAKRDKSLGIYNLQCNKQEPAITYSVTAGQNGLGLAINF